jgi:hypothetical protein
VKRDKWKNVNIEVYYHKGHNYNLDRLLVLKKSLIIIPLISVRINTSKFVLWNIQEHVALCAIIMNTIPFQRR